MTAVPATRHDAVSARSLAEVATTVREHLVRMAGGPVGAHLGGGLSCVEILVALYFDVLRVDPADPEAADRDHFVLSKGHASAALYATMAERGFLPVPELATYGRAGSRLAGHPLATLPGVEFGTGSLGHGLSLGVGLALAARMDGADRRTYVLLGDGELQEGSVWEAAMAASHLGLCGLTAVVDRNRLQITGDTEACVGLEPLADRWRAFGWTVLAVDGHDVEALRAVLAAPGGPGPRVVIAETVKGAGVRFLEGRKHGHYATLRPELVSRALAGLRRRGDR